MPAITRSPASPADRRAIRRGRCRPAGFTLTELLIVVALIALLVGLLLAALGQVQQKARQTTTLATMESFKNACEAFRQDHGYYPGLVPESVLIADANGPSGGIARISGTQNALLHMMGGAIREEDTPDYANTTVYPPTQWTEVTFDQSGADYKIKINLAKLGDGPVINGKPYAPYFTPAEGDLTRVVGLANRLRPANSMNILEPGGDANFVLPDLVDAWGQPIICLRRLRSIGPLTQAGGQAPQFDPASITPYTASVEDQSADPPAFGLGELEQPQEGSILPKGDGDSIALQNLDYVLGHPALADQSRGAIMLISAGADGIFFNETDGPGDKSNPVNDLVGGGYERKIIDEYDDVVLFGGS